jgi:hypothetical protein
VCPIFKHRLFDFQDKIRGVDTGVELGNLLIIQLKQVVIVRNGGEGGIRTPDTVTRMPHFECGAFNHSATSPWPPRRIRRLCIQRKTAKQGRSEPPRSTLPAEIALRAIEIAIMSMSLFCVRRPAGMPTKMGLRRAQRGPGMLDFQAQHEGG